MIVAVGWCADPQDVQQLRWQDGAQWASHVAPGPGVAPSDQAGAPVRTGAVDAGPGVAPIPYLVKRLGAWLRYQWLNSPEDSINRRRRGGARNRSHPLSTAYHGSDIKDD
ncbi:DUF2510 domain-containing protein [Pseudactinotalea sp. HY160]|uniref:DUF2510 domain-containing protein n=1 Tax=Pseudactinotalea sp. HY160 TaxID=2654490 RepID=UPI00128DDF3B|nr:DUF2510 domain-containing protein [Pseudactinotalea sp. HY160]